MKTKLKIGTLLLLMMNMAWSQQLTQTVRGTLIDQDSRSPLIGATVRILDSDPVQGDVTDLNGNFRIENVAIGRISLIITYVGYEEKVMPNLLVTSAKEVVVEVAMQESVENLDAVVVTAQKNKAEILNEMAMVSARSFTVEETQRYAGSFNDPARMVASYAGVTSNAEGNNDIVVRGNSPKGILWRLEGIEIPNPNHFANDGATGGPINALNGSMLDNSDFFTGAFAPEYGNALSGVFDMKFKKGNNEQREYAASIGILGIDFAAEGPFNQNYNGSYLINYRYSSLQLLNDAGVIDFGGIPKYQDLSYNVTLPLGKKNFISIFGLGGISSIAIEENDDQETLVMRETGGADMGVSGLIHTYMINDRTFLKNSFSISGTRTYYEADRLNDNNDFFETYDGDIRQTTYRLASTLNYKISAQHKIETGVIYSRLNFNTRFDYWNFEYNRTERQLDDRGGTNTFQGFTTWKYRISEDWTLTSGFHYLRFGLNSSQSIEPRLGVKWEVTPTSAFTVGFGLHSRLETVSTYLSKQWLEDGTVIMPNEELSPTKAAHFVIGYDQMLNSNTHFKVETYYQRLYNVPVEDKAGSYISLINATQSYYDTPFVNEGTGENYGVELTIEQYLHKGFYYLGTLSLYESFYTAMDDVKRRSAFNGNYVANFLAGKEFKVGAAEKNRVLFINTKMALLGGSRFTPIDLMASEDIGSEVRDESRPYAVRGDDIFYINLALGTRRNKGNTTREFKIDMMNVTNNQGIVNEYYSSTNHEVQRSPQLPFLPNIIYTFKF